MRFYLSSEYNYEQKQIIVKRKKSFYWLPPVCVGVFVDEFRQHADKQGFYVELRLKSTFLRFNDFARQANGLETAISKQN
jgi:hypothetical protein